MENTKQDKKSISKELPSKEKIIERELSIKEMELELKFRELELKENEFNNSKDKNSFSKQLFSPVGIAILAALIGFLANVFNGYLNLTQTKNKQQSDLILKVSEITDISARSANLLFFESIGFLHLNEDYIDTLRSYAGLNKDEAIPPPSLTNPINQPQIDDFTIDFIKKSISNFSLKAHQNQSGVWIIGYDTYKYPNNVRVKEGDIITQREADSCLRYELEIVSKKVNSLLLVQLDYYQYNALISFTYHVGEGSLKSSKLLNKINSTNFMDVPIELIKWCKASGEIDLEQQRIRESEIELWERNDGPKG